MADKDAFDINPIEIVRSLASRSEADRIAAAGTLGTLVAGPDLSIAQREGAHTFLTTLSTDANERVRASVARAIATYPLLPRSLAEQLANDMLEVAAPILAKSPVLTDTFLIDLISSGRADESTQVSIAMRDALSELVSGSLLEKGKVRAVETVLSNKSARIDEQGYGALLARTDLDGRMLTLAASRPDLSAPIVAQCHTIVLAEHFEREAGRAIRETLITHHALPPDMADTIVQTALEDALAKETAEATTTDEDLINLATSLNGHGDLTPSLLLRMTCNGSLSFAAATFHVLTGQPLKDVYAAFGEAGIKNLTTLYHQSELAPYFRFALITAIKRITEEEAKPYRGDADKPVKDIVREIVGFYRGVAPASVDEVINQLSHEASRWSEDSDAASSSV